MRRGGDGYANELRNMMEEKIFIHSAISTVFFMMDTVYCIPTYPIIGKEVHYALR